MIFLVIFCLIIICYILLKRKKTVIEKIGDQYFDNEIPENYKKYLTSEVAGLFFRKKEAQGFANGANQSLEFEREFNNSHDKYAIKIIGITASSRYFIGYIPKDISKQIVETDMLNNIQPLLIKIYQNFNNDIEIKFIIIGLKSTKEIFDAYKTNEIATPNQKEFLKFFKITIPKNLTTSQAKKIINEHTKKLEKEDPQQLQEFNSYDYIFEQFEDKDFREDNMIKKINKTIIHEALNKLIQQEKTYHYLSENPEEIVELILTNHPDLTR